VQIITNYLTVTYNENKIIVIVKNNELICKRYTGEQDKYDEYIGTVVEIITNLV